MGKTVKAKEHDVHAIDQIETLVADIRSSAKYRSLSEDLVRRIGARELASHPGLKAAIQKTREALHQAAGAYCEGSINYEKWRTSLEAAEPGSEEFRELCTSMMQRHASTRERLPHLDQFYSLILRDSILKDVGPINSVIDIACGLNPLSLPWMPFDSNVRYSAYDLYADMMEFLGYFLQRCSIKHTCEVREVISNPPQEVADIAFVLKFLPLLEQVQRGGSLEFLEALNVRYILVSFPTQSLGGRGKGMAHNYERRFLESTKDKTWHVERFKLPNELCFLIQK